MWTVAFAPRYNNGLCWAVGFALTDSKWRFCPKAACAAVHGLGSRSPSCRSNANEHTCKKRHALLSMRFIKMSQAWFKPLERHICDPYFAGLFFLSQLLLTVFSCLILVLPDNNLALYTWKLFTLLFILTDMVNDTEQMIKWKDEKHNNNNNNSMVIGHKITVSHKEAVLAIQYFNDKITILNEKDA